jgi:hypothetical protein
MMLMTTTETYSPSSFAMAFREWFGLTRAQANILAELYAAAGGFRTSRELGAAAGTAAGSAPFHLVDIRKALEVEAVDSEPGRGYRLTDEGMAECRDALLRIGQELLGAA